MGQGKSRLEVEAVTKGFDKVAGDAQKVDEALKGIGKTTEEGVKITENADDAQKKLNASIEQLGFLLGQVAFGFRGLGARMFSVIRVMGDFATKQIQLGKVTEMAGAMLGKFAGTLKTLGAALFVYVGISRLIEAITTLRREMKEAEEATKAVIKAQTELEKQARETAEALTASRATKRRQEPRTFEQEEAIRKTIEAAPADIKEAIKPILEALGGAKGFGPGAGIFTGGELESLTRLGFKPDDEVPQRINERRAQAELQRSEDQLRVIQQNLRDRQKARTERAAAEAWTGKGGESLNEIVASASQTYSQDPAVMQEIAEQMLFDEAEFLRSIRTWPEAAQESVRRQRGRMPGERVGYRSTTYWGGGGMPEVEVGGESRKITAEEILVMTEIYKRLLPLLERMAENGPVTVTNNNTRIFGADGDSQRKRMIRGETMRGGWEGN